MVLLRVPKEDEFNEIEAIEASWAHVADAGFSAFQAMYYRDWLYLLIFDGKKVVGYMIVIMGEGEIFRLAVDSNHQGKGYAKSALRQACHLIKALGFKTAKLTVYAENTRAVGLYESQGWKEVKRSGSKITMRFWLSKI